MVDEENPKSRIAARTARLAADVAERTLMIRELIGALDFHMFRGSPIGSMLRRDHCFKRFFDRAKKLGTARLDRAPMDTLNDEVHSETRFAERV